MATRGKRTAVVVIHGIGEQVPMKTLRGFVRAVWLTDETLFDSNRIDSSTGARRLQNPIWSKPDVRNRSFELRRITTETAKNNRSCDFYELYWADIMQGTTWEHMQVWILDLLIRSPKRVPRALLPAWIMLWTISLIALGFIIWGLIPRSNLAPCTNGATLCWSAIGPAIVAVFGLTVSGLVSFILLRYVGDAARYLSVRPTNVGRRQQIRERGIQLLEDLMELPPEGRAPPDRYKYDRIVVVGHSLGAIIGYDMLKFAFSRVNRSFKQDPNAVQPARAALESMIREAADGTKPLEIRAFREAQDQVRAEYLGLGSPWIVSDFVTIGAPLAHAGVLLADDEEDLDAQKAARILPTCPPEMELDRTTKRMHFSYWPGARRDDDDLEEALLTRIPHHAAHFALTRWTNLYSPASAIFWGDVISGPLAGVFGMRSRAGVISGIEDVAVLTGTSRFPAFFTHTRYWDFKAPLGQATPPHITALRAALDLGRQ